MAIDRRAWKLPLHDSIQSSVNYDVSTAFADGHRLVCCLYLGRLHTVCLHPVGEFTDFFPFFEYIAAHIRGRLQTITAFHLQTTASTLVTSTDFSLCSSVKCQDCLVHPSHHLLVSSAILLETDLNFP